MSNARTCDRCGKVIRAGAEFTQITMPPKVHHRNGFTADLDFCKTCTEALAAWVKCGNRKRKGTRT